METDIDPDHFKIRDASSYDAVAGDFDRFTQRLSAPLAQRMMMLAQPRPGERILDIGTGTGIVALQSVPYVVPDGTVVGIDLSEGMLAVAQDKAAKMGLAKHAEFRRMDGEALNLDDQSFDVALSLFALLHFPNPSVALAEIFRVLRPGGRLVVAVGSRPPLWSLSGLRQAFVYMYQLERQRRGKLLIAPDFLNSLVVSQLPEPLESEESALAHRGLNRGKSVLTLVTEAKFTHAKTCWYGHRAMLSTSEEFWSIQRTFSSLARKRLLKATPDKLAALQNAFFSTCLKVQARNGELCYPFGAFYVTAQRPFH